MKNASILAILWCLIVTAAPAAHAQTVDEALRADIRALFALTNVVEAQSQAARLLSGPMLDGLRASRPGVPPRVIEVMKSVLEAEFAKGFEGPDGITEQMVSIYARHFTHEDVRGLVRFYSSELGRKAIGAQPLLAQEGAAIGQQWAQKEMPRIMTVIQASLRAEGLIP